VYATFPLAARDTAATAYCAADAFIRAKSQKPPSRVPTEMQKSTGGTHKAQTQSRDFYCAEHAARMQKRGFDGDGFFDVKFVNKTMAPCMCISFITFRLWLCGVDFCFISPARARF
jgi:hypothetical protein